MRLRWKLMVLLTLLAIPPLVLVSCLARSSMHQIGQELGGRTRDELVERASRQLLQLAENYSRLISDRGEATQRLVEAQAEQTAALLAEASPTDATIYYAEDFDTPGREPRDTVPSTLHFEKTAEGLVPIPISREHCVFKLAPDVARSAVAEDVARLSKLTRTFAFVRDVQPRFIYWQYVALESGVHVSYPGHGGYPEEYDPRLRLWYRNALSYERPVWNAAMRDVTTDRAVLTLSMPIRDAGGAVIGATGADIDLVKLVESVAVPIAWSTRAETMFVLTPNQVNLMARRLLRVPEENDGLLIIAQRSYDEQADSAADWNAPLNLAWLNADDPKTTQAVIAKIAERKPAVHEAMHNGQRMLWAYAPLQDGTENASLLLAVPYDDIAYHALAAQEEVVQRMDLQFLYALTVVSGLAVVVFLAALVASRSVTKPVAALATAARRIAEGDFDTRTNIRSADELGELGRTFDEMVPRLADHMRLRDSLSLAQQVQQRLLPQSPPQIPGIDVAATSKYCDETGGDYFDFFLFERVAPRCLGIAVGDVTGHGVAAALLMATARALLRSRSEHSGALADVVNAVNRQLSRDTDGYRFMTMIYFTLDADTRMARWCGAGHDPPFVYDLATGAHRELDGGGIPLGISSDWRYEDSEAQLPHHPLVLVIGTDGIWEARNPAGEMYGKARLRDAIASAAAHSAEAIKQAILDDLAAFCAGATQEDDVTLVVAKLSENGVAADQ